MTKVNDFYVVFVFWASFIAVSFFVYTLTVNEFPAFWLWWFTVGYGYIFMSLILFFIAYITYKKGKEMENET
ncbi:MAG: hypothetical protein ABIJ74_01060 [archaeon]